MAHEPTKMIADHRTAQKHRHNTRRGIRHFNHWYWVYRCPVCGAFASKKRQPIICRGEQK